MEGIHLRSKQKKSLYPKLIIVILSVVVLILIKATVNVFIKSTETKENLAETQEDLGDLEQREIDLENEIQELSTERGIDREIRSKFRVTKDGEGMIMLIDSPDITSTTTDGQDDSLWSRIKSLF